MKSLWYVPLTYVAGVHGFAIFAPYLVLFLTIVLVTRPRYRRRLRLLAAAIRRRQANSTPAAAEAPVESDIPTSAAFA